MRHRRARVVLWGGRPSRDRQFGGPYDLLYAKVEHDYAGLRRNARALILPPIGRTVTGIREEVMHGDDGH